ncbi:substrate-binding domain-containing protein, partial [Streptosporangium sp. NPDC005286]|uniref:substrate-binding domain-containing protein n=1 Tax=Streptosporangium sp. NPDC005286 TaxID=3154463 RepID=UPI0033A60C43
DLMALGAIRACRDRGLSVPGEVSVVGFDDSPLIAFTDPPLTTVRQPVQSMVTAAVHTLLEAIAGTAGQHSELIFQPEFIVRGSTGSGPKVLR